MTIDISKQYRTRSGLDVENLRIDPCRHGFYIRGVVVNPQDQTETHCSWTSEGRYFLVGEHDRDLVEAPERTQKPKPRLLVSTDKKYRTIEGKEVRIYSTDNGGNYPVHGAVRDEKSDKWIIQTWTAEGNQCLAYRDTDPHNLVEVKPRVQREYWANIYPDTIPALHATRKRAEKCVMSGRIACVKVVIDCEEGEGL